MAWRQRGWVFFAVLVLFTTIVLCVTCVPLGTAGAEVSANQGLIADEGLPGPTLPFGLSSLSAVPYTLPGLVRDDQEITSLSLPAGVSVVSEIISKRTANSTTYQLSNGLCQLVIYNHAIRYKDAAGDWQMIDPTLSSAGVTGGFRTTKTPYDLTIGSEGSGNAPVELSWRGYRVSIGVSGVTEKSPAVLGSNATYGIDGQAQISYQATYDGVEQTISLASAGSDQYVATLSHPGLGLRCDATDQWGFYAAGKTEPIFLLSDITVIDSSADEFGNPAQCEKARMVVKPGEGQSTLTYEVPASWLADSKRVFPVKIDPTITIYPGAGDVTYCDTSVGSGQPNNSHGPGTQLWAGWGTYNGHDGFWRDLVKFDLSSIPANSYISSATFKMYKFYAGGSGTYENVGISNQQWTCYATWNRLGLAENSFPASYATRIAHVYVSANAWLSVSATSVVQDWVAGRMPNNGFTVWQSESSSYRNPAYLSKFYSADNSIGSAYWPKLQVTYQPIAVISKGTAATEATTGWWDAGDGNNDTNTSGRGSVSLSWPASNGADGYSIYLSDGATYQKVGQAVGNTSTSWSSDGQGFYPSDSGIEAGFTAYGNNPFYRASTPNTDTLTATLSPSWLGASDSTGLIVSDGSYLYVRQWYNYTGPTKWTKVDKSTGAKIAELGSDLSAKPARSAFLLGSYIYNGYVTATDANTATIQRSALSNGALSSFIFQKPLLKRDGGTAPANSGLIHLACDGTHIYSVAYSLDATSPGAYNGYKIRVYDTDGSFVADHSIPMSSRFLNGLFADDNYLYLMQWSGEDGAEIIKISTTSWQVINTWGINQGSTRVVNGCYDATNHVFWLGALDKAKIRKYADAHGGLNLRDNPGPLYTEITGDPGASSYTFVVCPYNATNGEVPISANTPILATIDNRTVPLHNDPQHTTSSLSSFAGNDLTAVLDDGVAQVDATDLAIASCGPSAALSRCYRSSNTQAGYFAPGWRFSFEASLQNIVTSGPDPGCDYVDAAGDSHHFVLAGGIWHCPTGMAATLTQNGSIYTLVYANKETLTFSASGSSAKLTQESDRNGNAVTYTWASNSITIAAANGQQIMLSLSSGKIVSAIYTTSDGTREINYTTSAPWRVTSYPSSSAQQVTEYSYDGSSRLISITAKDWPSSGQNAALVLSYTNGKLSEVQYPDYNAQSNPEAHVQISYTANGATIANYGRINDTANTTVSESFTWGETNAIASDTVSSGGSSITYDFETSATNDPSACKDPTNQEIKTSYTAQGEPAADYDEQGHCTSYTYDDSNNHDLPTTVTNSLSGVTRNTYDTAGNLTVVVTALSAADADAGIYTSYTENTYDSHGRLTQTKQLISSSDSPVWAQTDYADFALCGQPQTITYHDVKLSSGGAAADRIIHKTYDAFGNLLTQTDTSGSRTIETDTYDIAGQLATSIDATGLVTHASYDNLGNQIESWQTVAGSGRKANWSQSAYDALGRKTSETSLLSDASGNPTTESVVTNTYDGLGRQVTSSNSTVGGQPEKWIYDRDGNVLKHWTMGVADYSDGRATVSTYDTNDRLTSQTEPGDSAASTCEYDVAGKLTKQTNPDPDDSFVSYTYDTEGNKTSETVPLAGYSSNHNNVAVTTYSYDAACRLIALTNPDGGKTAYGYDLLGRQISASGYFDPSKPNDPSGVPTIIAYNALGWVLSASEGSGLVTSNTYDAAGRLLSVQRGNQTAVASTYDDAGRLLTQTTTDADSTVRVLTYVYDNYGNKTEETHSVGGTTIKDITTVYDSLGRPIDDDDSVTGVAHTWTYPLNTPPNPDDVCESTFYDATPTTTLDVCQNARGQEAKRTVTVDGQSYVRTIDSRDNAERITQTTFNSSSVANFSFDGAGRALRQWGNGYQSGAQNTDAFTYNADSGKKSADNLLLATVGNFGAVTGSYSYDGNGRLTAATVNGISATYGFDEANNLSQITSGGTTTTLDYNSANQLQSATCGSAVTVFDWDKINDFRISQGPQANPTQIQYSYTAGGQLRTYTDSARGVSATYSYDATGQRTKSVVVIGTTTTSTTYKYAGIELLELSATYTDTANPDNNTSWKIDYLRDEDDDLYGGVYRSPSISASPIAFSIVSGGRGDVLELLDADGNPFAAYRYDAWGNPQGGTNDQWGNPTGTQSQATNLITSTLAGQIASRQILRYAAYAYDGESYLYYLSARSYDPATGQFLSYDPVKPDGEESAYQYCGGDPVSNADPTGYRFWDTISRGLKSAWHAVERAGRATKSAFKTAGKATGGAFKTAKSATWNALKNAKKAMWNALKTAGKTTGGALKTAGRATWSGTKWLGRTVADKGKEFGLRVKEEFTWRTVGDRKITQATAEQFRDGFELMSVATDSVTAAAGCTLQVPEAIMAGFTSGMASYGSYALDQALNDVKKKKDAMIRVRLQKFTYVGLIWRVNIGGHCVYLP